MATSKPFHQSTGYPYTLWFYEGGKIARRYQGGSAALGTTSPDDCLKLWDSMGDAEAKTMAAALRAAMAKDAAMVQYRLVFRNGAFTSVRFHRATDDTAGFDEARLEADTMADEMRASSPGSDWKVDDVLFDVKAEQAKTEANQRRPYFQGYPPVKEGV